jgi:hypothetical protein
MVCFTLYCSETGTSRLPKSMGQAVLFYPSGSGVIRTS